MCKKCDIIPLYHINKWKVYKVGVLLCAQQEHSVWNMLRGVSRNIPREMKSHKPTGIFRARKLLRKTLKNNLVKEK